MKYLELNMQNHHVNKEVALKAFLQTINSPYEIVGEEYDPGIWCGDWLYHSSYEPFVEFYNAGWELNQKKHLI